MSKALIWQVIITGKDLEIIGIALLVSVVLFFFFMICSDLGIIRFGRDDERYLIACVCLLVFFISLIVGFVVRYRTINYGDNPYHQVDRTIDNQAIHEKLLEADKTFGANSNNQKNEVEYYSCQEGACNGCIENIYFLDFVEEKINWVCIENKKPNAKSSRESNLTCNIDNEAWQIHINKYEPKNSMNENEKQGNFTGFANCINQGINQFHISKLITKNI